MDRYAYDRSARNAVAESQRGKTRDSLFLTAQLRIADKETNVRVRNLSAGGLMAEYGRAVEIDTPVQIDVRGVGWVDGRVAWSVDGRLGIAFEEAIDPMAARKPVGNGSTTPAYVKPILPRR